ncbi:MAG: hypothetical protein KGJ04_00115 [Gammaproteobacteria bacterium]|nr:hypothetical protein [Gammaproteobacteria bacterium]
MDRLYGPRDMVLNAQLYAQARHADLAVPLFAKALASPGIGAFYSPVLLRLDPFLDPIRHDPRFQALLQQYANYKPTVTYDTAAPAVPSAPASTH